MEIAKLKRKLRGLKKLEGYIREASFAKVKEEQLTWHLFFSTNEKDRKGTKYPLEELNKMNHDERKEVFQEYFFHIYFYIYRRNPLVAQVFYDPKLLTFLGLSPEANETDIKKRFRELAKKYHPDHGGDGEEMRKLLDTYKELMKD